ncbi:MAG: DUF4345 domain-containing protein [Bacteroidota bacterium]
MNTLKISKIYLFIAGVILSIVGGLTTFTPVAIKANEGIQIAGNTSALNDVRAFGMLLLATVLLLFLGIVKNALLKTAMLSSFLLFLSLGVGRLTSILLDGMPSDGIVKATGLEFLLGLIGLFLFIANTKKQSF